MFGTFRFKLTLWYSLVLAFVLLVFSYTTYFALSHAIQEQIDNSLWSIAETEVASLMDSASGKLSIHEASPHMVSTQGLLNNYIQLLDNQGTIISKSNNLTQDELPFSQELLTHSLAGEIGFETVMSPEKGSLRLISLPIVNEGTVNYILQVGTSLQSTEKILNNFMFFLWPLALGSVALASLGGWFLARHSLKPVGKITETAKAISDKSLDKRLDHKVTHDEIGQLVEVLNDMLDRLEQAFTSQKRFIADASHELRSPLTALKGTLEVLLRRKRSTEEYAEGLASCLEEIDRLIRLVNSLLTLAHTDIGQESLNRQNFRLDTLVKNISDQTQILAYQKNIRLETNIENGIEYSGDSDKLRQLIFNLIDNAIRYTPKEGSIKILLQKSEKTIKLSVSDNGIGISSDVLPHIFERFYRAAHTRSQDDPGGSGLGLAICQWIVNAHHGQITVDSVPNKGTTFTVSLPTS